MNNSSGKRKQKRKRCEVDGCDKQAQNGGVCRAHGAEVKRCEVDGCKNQVVKGGVCIRHGAEVKLCIVEACYKIAQNGGVCIEHGAEVKRCEFDGCNNRAVKGGVCVTHGAEVKRCEFDGCNNKVVKGGVCVTHGAKVKRCSFDGCDKQAQKGGVCVAHGAKVKRCSFDGCDKQAQKGGRCIRHGGGKPNLPCELCFIYSKRYTMTEVNGTTIRVCRTCKRRSKRIRLDSKEYKVLTFLKTNYKQPIIAANRKIKHKACVNRLPDILYADPNRSLIIEVDEYQHSAYTDSICEDKRISEIYEDFMGMEMIVVRFNPDGYQTKSKKLSFEERLEVLLRTLEEIEVKKFDTKIHLYYLFYSESSPQLSKNFSYTLIN